MGLLAGGMNTCAASPKPKLRKQLVHLAKRLHRRPRSTQIHAGASRGVEHPRRHDDDHARREFDMNHLTGGSLLAVLTPYASSVQWVPAVEDLNILRDMRTMTQ